MEKRIISILLMVCLCMTVLTGCEGSSGATGTPAEPASDMPATGPATGMETDALPAEDIPAEPPVAMEEPTQELPAEFVVEIDWTEVSYTTTDQDGYTYEITFKFSPWILLSNTDIVNSAWAEVGGNHVLPGFDGWGFRKNGNSYTRSVYDGAFYHDISFHMTDMYYCLGTVEIINKTEGWSISSDSPRTLYENFHWSIPNPDDRYHSNAIYRLFYSDSERDARVGVNFGVTMQGDNCSLPFIIIAPENFTPAFPDGERVEDMLNGYFSYAYFDSDHALHSGDGETYLGVFGKDGTYTPPINAE